MNCIIDTLIFLCSFGETRGDFYPIWTIQQNLDIYVPKFVALEKVEELRWYYVRSKFTKKGHVWRHFYDIGPHNIRLHSSPKTSLINSQS